MRNLLGVLGVGLCLAACGGSSDLEPCVTGVTAPPDFPSNASRVGGYDRHHYAVTWTQYKPRGSIAISHDGGVGWEETRVDYQAHAVYAAPGLLVVGGASFREETDPIFNAVVEVSYDDGATYEAHLLASAPWTCAVTDLRAQGDTLIALGDCPDAKAWISGDGGATWASEPTFATTPRCNP